MQPEVLYQNLLDSGYSEAFAERAVHHSHLFAGDLQQFAGLIEQIIEDEGKSETTLMDAGARRVEHDYNGDNLTTGGYDHVDKNCRW